jgi:hypothetical protein
MSSLRALQKLNCTACNEVTLHRSLACLHCGAQQSPIVVSRDEALKYGAQSPEAAARRLKRMGHAAAIRGAARP